MKLGSSDASKRWTDYDQRILDAALTTGRLPDGSAASQNRLARYLGFSRMTIIIRLDGRKLPLAREAMRDGGIRSAYGRAIRRAIDLLGKSAKVRSVEPTPRHSLPGETYLERMKVLMAERAGGSGPFRNRKLARNRGA